VECRRGEVPGRQRFDPKRSTRWCGSSSAVGARISEVPGISRKGPDGLPDLTLDSLDRGHADLRLRWDAGTKGVKTRRVPVCTRLVTEVKRYEARHQPETRRDALLIRSASEASRSRRRALTR